MTAITFDTLAYVKTLRDAGVEEKQAEAQASALASVLKTSAGDLATKQDVDRLEARLNLMEERSDGRFKLLQWMLAFNLAISVALLWILIRTATAG
ncbi:MAG TPA: DUF1640 domain-containing protein [Candidatus Competibacteraceae bacterium]|nr:DUF1640 domain-containing protein [Candidatus Competibacteraceae bacterium]